MLPCVRGNPQGGAFWVTDASAPSGVTIERSQLANNRAAFTGGGSVRVVRLFRCLCCLLRQRRLPLTVLAVLLLQVSG